MVFTVRSPDHRHLGKFVKRTPFGLLLGRVILALQSHSIRWPFVVLFVQPNSFILNYKFRYLHIIYILKLFIIVAKLEFDELQASTSRFEQTAKFTVQAASG